MNKQFLTAGSVAGLLIFHFALFSQAWSGFWRWDDASIIRHIQDYPLFLNLLSPDVWQSFSSANLTPWVLFSYTIDLGLFGLNPAFFYLHQLLALLICGVAMYLLLRLWIGHLFALYGAGLFLLGTPPVMLTQMMMTRHYLEGLAFCLLSLFFFVKYLRTDKRSLLVISTCMYLLAVLAKEIYVPLAVLLPFLPEAQLRKRILAAIPAMLVVVLYSLWRGYMLGVLLGGYEAGNSTVELSFLTEVITSFGRFPLLLFGTFWPLVLLVFMMLLIPYVKLRQWPLLTSVFILSLILLPLVPLVRNPGIAAADRYLLLLWAALCFAIAYFGGYVYDALGRAAMRRRSMVFVVAGVSIVVVTSVNSLGNFRRLMVTADEYDVQGRFIWNNSGEMALLPSQTLSQASWYAMDLKAVKLRVQPGSESAQLVLDAMLLNEGVEKLFEYDAACRCMVDVSDSIESRYREIAAKNNPAASLEASIRYSEGLFSWSFGPYEQGIYRVIHAEFGSIAVPATGRVRVKLSTDVPMYLKYESPEGWVTYSEQLLFGSNESEIQWSR